MKVGLVKRVRGIKNTFTELTKYDVNPYEYRGCGKKKKRKGQLDISQKKPLFSIKEQHHDELVLCWKWEGGGWKLLFVPTRHVTISFSSHPESRQKDVVPDLVVILCLSDWIENDPAGDQEKKKRIGYKEKKPRRP